MSGTQPPHSRAELAARWRADAQVFRRYGSTGRGETLSACKFVTYATVA